MSCRSEAALAAADAAALVERPGRRRAAAPRARVERRGRAARAAPRLRQRRAHLRRLRAARRALLPDARARPPRPRRLGARRRASLRLRLTTCAISSASLAALGVERLVLVGHSLGGRIATLFAGAHPERMAGLVLVDSAPELDARGMIRIRQDVEKRRWRAAEAPRSARSPSTSGCSRSRTRPRSPPRCSAWRTTACASGRTAASSARPTPRSTPARAA